MTGKRRDGLRDKRFSALALPSGHINIHEHFSSVIIQSVSSKDSMLLDYSSHAPEDSYP